MAEILQTPGQAPQAELTPVTPKRNTKLFVGIIVAAVSIGGGALLYFSQGTLYKGALKLNRSPVTTTQISTAPITTVTNTQSQTPQERFAAQLGAPINTGTSNSTSNATAPSTQNTAMNQLAAESLQVGTTSSSGTTIVLDSTFRAAQQGVQERQRETGNQIPQVSGSSRTGTLNTQNTLGKQTSSSTSALATANPTAAIGQTAGLVAVGTSTGAQTTAGTRTPGTTLQKGGATEVATAIEQTTGLLAAGTSTGSQTTAGTRTPGTTLQKGGATEVATAIEQTTGLLALGTSSTGTTTKTAGTENPPIMVLARPPGPTTNLKPAPEPSTRGTTAPTGTTTDSKPAPEPSTRGTTAPTGTTTEVATGGDVTVQPTTDAFKGACGNVGGTFSSGNNSCKVSNTGIFYSIEELQNGLVAYDACKKTVGSTWDSVAKKCKASAETTTTGSTEPTTATTLVTAGTESSDAKTAPATTTAATTIPATAQQQDNSANAALIQGLQNQISALQQQLANSQNNSAILQQIAALDARLQSLGGQASSSPQVITINTTSPSTQQLIAPTACSNPTYTFDSTRGVCVPPTEIVVRDAGQTSVVPARARSTRTIAAASSAGNEPGGSGQGETSAFVAVSEPRAVGISGANANANRTARTHGAFIQGQTGPEVLLYPVLIGAANGLYYIARRRKKAL